MLIYIQVYMWVAFEGSIELMFQDNSPISLSK